MADAQGKLQGNFCMNPEQLPTDWSLLRRVTFSPGGSCAHAHENPGIELLCAYSTRDFGNHWGIREKLPRSYPAHAARHCTRWLVDSASLFPIRDSPRDPRDAVVQLDLNARDLASLAPEVDEVGGVGLARSSGPPDPLVVSLVDVFGARP